MLCRCVAHAIFNIRNDWERCQHHQQQQKAKIVLDTNCERRRIINELSNRMKWCGKRQQSKMAKEIEVGKRRCKNGFLCACVRVYAWVLSLNKFWWCYFRCGGSGFGPNISHRSCYFFFSKERCYNHVQFRDPSANDSSIIQQHIWIFSHCLNSLGEVVRVLPHRLMELPSLRLYFVKMIFFVCWLLAKCFECSVSTKVVYELVSKGRVV